METTEKLPKHLNTAVNAIHKQIDKYTNRIFKLVKIRDDANDMIEAMQEEIKGLQEHIAKLKGE